MSEYSSGNIAEITEVRVPPIQDILEQRSQFISSLQIRLKEVHNPPQLERVVVSDADKIKLSKIKELFEMNLDDGLFAQRLDEIRDLLPSIFAEMKGLKQTPHHHQIDPVDHTINALSLLNTLNLSDQDRHIARATLLFHDIGKKFDPKDREHPRLSVDIAKQYLLLMNYDQQDMQRILQHIEWHDALGDVTRRDGQSIFDPHDVMTYFPTVRELELHRRITLADIHSIPGLKKYLNDIEAVYRLMENRMYAEQKWCEPDLNQQVPFVLLTMEEMAELEELHEQEYFDDLDIADNVKKRQHKYKEFTLDQQEKIKKTIVQCALQNNEYLLFSLKLTGREIDRTFVTELEEEYGVNLDNVRIAQEMFSMSYCMWKLNKKVPYIRSDDKYAIGLVREQLQELMKSAHFLSAYQLIATHVTHPQFEEKIDEDQILIRSDSGEGSHFEGDGIYAGILGSYQDWSSGKVYSMKIPLADSLPMIVSFNHPHAMVNMLGEILDIKDSGDHIAVTHGLRQFRQCKYGTEEIDQWKINLLGDLLKSEPHIINMDGENCLVIDTDKDAIVWGSLVRALRIRRFVPLSEVSKLHIPEAIKVAYKENVQKQDSIIVIEPDPYMILANSIRTIRGIKARDLPEY